jgi:hypothetical protein
VAFPLQTCEQKDIPEACCGTLFDLADDILKAVVPFMEECIAATPCCGDPMRYFVSIGRPETWQSDFLALYLENVRVDQLSTRNLTTLMPPILLGQWRFLLSESCYPGLIVKGDKTYTPTDEEFHLAAAHGYAHVQALLRGLLDFAASRDCRKFTLRDVQPTRPEMYSAGWTIGFDFELP